MRRHKKLKIHLKLHYNECLFEEKANDNVSVRERPLKRTFLCVILNDPIFSVVVSNSVMIYPSQIDLAIMTENINEAITSHLLNLEFLHYIC